MEVRDDGLVLRSVNGAIVERWWFERLVSVIELKVCEKPLSAIFIRLTWHILQRLKFYVCGVEITNKRNFTSIILENVKSFIIASKKRWNEAEATQELRPN